MHMIKECESVAAVHTYIHTDSLKNNKKENIEDRVNLSCANLDTG